MKSREMMNIYIYIYILEGFAQLRRGMKSHDDDGDGDIDVYLDCVGSGRKTAIHFFVFLTRERGLVNARRECCHHLAMPMTMHAS